MPILEIMKAACPSMHEQLNIACSLSCSICTAAWRTFRRGLVAAGGLLPVEGQAARSRHLMMSDWAKPAGAPRCRPWLNWDRLVPLLGRSAATTFRMYCNGD